MEKEKSRRYPMAGELEADLERLLAYQRSLARPATRLEKAVDRMLESLHRLFGSCRYAVQIMKRRQMTIFGLILAAAAVGGCTRGYTLETGYKVRPLQASPTEIRGFYAERFTPEARAAQLEREQERAARRPQPGY
ncbi:MAG: hypothetical protein NZ561_08840 [Phycisphaerae bacterium]|nr:hypothetical protein [Phycisphaerae bacterium]MDW8260964.1 hypothetical protein [Phycisphaerales bacterium]